MCLSGGAQEGYPRFGSDGKGGTHFLLLLGWFWRAVNSVLAGESPNLHPVSLNAPPIRFWWGVIHQLWWLLFSARHTTQSSLRWCCPWAQQLWVPHHKNLHFLGCAEERSTWDFCTSQPWCANHISLSAGWIIARLRNYEYSNYRSMTFVTRRRRMGKIAISQCHKSFSCINSYSQPCFFIRAIIALLTFYFSLGISVKFSNAFIFEKPKWYDSFIFCQKELTYLEIFSTC